MHTVFYQPLKNFSNTRIQVFSTLKSHHPPQVSDWSGQSPQDSTTITTGGNVLDIYMYETMMHDVVGCSQSVLVESTK